MEALAVAPAFQAAPAPSALLTGLTFVTRRDSGDSGLWTAKCPELQLASSGETEQKAVDSLRRVALRQVQDYLDDAEIVRE